MANENVTSVANQSKRALVLNVEFERKRFTGDDGREANYVQCIATYKGEAFRFSVKDKDARLFQFLMKQDGFPITDLAGNLVTE